MISLKELFSLLATGEFSNLSLAKDSRGRINESEYGSILPQINLAVIELYKRFKLLEEDLVISVTPTRSTYILGSANTALPGETTEDLYIEHELGANAPINLIEIKDVFDEEGIRLRMNNGLCVPYIRKKSMNTLKITNVEEACKLNIVYQAHPTLPVLDDTFDVDTCVIDVPPTFLEAILYYTAARKFRPMGANNSTATADKSSAYFQQYELACQKIELYGLDVEEEDRDEGRFAREGWV